MKTSALIESAVHLLWDGKYINDLRYDECHEFVCHALEAATSAAVTQYELAGMYTLATETWGRYMSLRHKINNALGSAWTVDAWLLNKGVIPDDSKSVPRPVMQDYRKRWMQHMAKTYRKAGD